MTPPRVSADKLEIIELLQGDGDLDIRDFRARFPLMCTPGGQVLARRAPSTWVQIGD